MDTRKNLQDEIAEALIRPFESCLFRFRFHSVRKNLIWINKRARFLRVSRCQNQFLPDIDLETFNEETSIKAAIVVPVHLPFGQIAVAIFSFTDRRRSDLSPEFKNINMILEGLARRFLSSYVATTRENAYLPRSAVLTLREAECLRWAAFGKTDAEILTILGRNHGTIHYRLTKICQKLKSDHHAQAIF